MIAFPKLAYVAFSLSQPFLIQEAVSLVQNADAGDSDNVGYGLIGGFALVYTGLAVCVLSLVCRVGTDLIGLDHHGLGVTSYLSPDDHDARWPNIYHIS